eukprot:4571626-Pleurochrysis_carterae.AAC.5
MSPGAPCAPLLSCLPEDSSCMLAPLACGPYGPPAPSHCPLTLPLSQRMDPPLASSPSCIWPTLPSSLNPS